MSASTRAFRAHPNDADDLESVLTLYSATLGVCRICSHAPRDLDDRQKHLEQHRWEITPEGLRETRRLDRPAWSGHFIRRRLGLLLWKLHRVRGKSAAQIQRDVRLPPGVTGWALTLPKSQKARVLHLHRQGLLSGEIAEFLELPVRTVDRNLGGVHWTSWLAECCPPGWGSMPLLGAAIAKPTSKVSETPL